MTMLEATERVKRREPIVQRVHPQHPDAKFLLSLSPGEVVLLNIDGEEGLYTFETAASTSTQMWFRHHAAGGKSSDKKGVVSKKPGTFTGRKVTVDPLGRIRRAND